VCLNGTGPPAVAVTVSHFSSRTLLRHIRYLKVDATPIRQDLEKAGYGLPDAFKIGENWISEGTAGIAHGPVLLMIEKCPDRPGLQTIRVQRTHPCRNSARRLPVQSRPEDQLIDY
jgi:hypothetical protein